MSTALGLRSSLTRISRAGARYASGQRTQRVQTTPNPTMEHDPSLLLLLRDVDHAVKRTKAGKKGKGPAPAFGLRDSPIKNAEFEEVPGVVSLEPPPELDGEDGLYDSERKAPAALMGGIKAKCISLPYELVAQMDEIIEESDKRQLRSDAKRLYERTEAHDDESSDWVTDDPEYKSRKQAQDRAYRDGLAYAAVVMPLHYSSIYNVFKQMDLRFGPDFKVTNLVDMGCHAGEALWAARAVFAEDEESRVKNYFGVDPRLKMLYMGERLIQDVSLYGCNATFHSKLSQALPGGLAPEAAAETVVVNAFDLSRHARWRDRRDRLYEMWQTGAETLVLIEAGTREGYEFIAEAREYLLRLGLVEMADARDPALEPPTWTPGLHVAMPCPHDGPCAVLPELKFTCAFGQQYESPQFTRQTTHTPGGMHDTAKHAYVVLRRGPRPENPGTALGRVGLVGKRWEAKQHAREPTELREHGEGDSRILIPEVKKDLVYAEDGMPTVELQEALRKEAMFWPRLNMPPLKKPGHIVMDACTSSGAIQRLTISRSRGKQEFYDARKSSWGDSFPHEPTIPPVQRFRPLRRAANFDVEESALAAMELVLNEQRRKQNEGRNKWNKFEKHERPARNRAHLERREARKLDQLART